MRSAMALQQRSAIREAERCPACDSTPHICTTDGQQMSVLVLLSSTCPGTSLHITSSMQFIAGTISWMRCWAFGDFDVVGCQMHFVRSSLGLKHGKSKFFER